MFVARELLKPSLFLAVLFLWMAPAIPASAQDDDGDSDRNLRRELRQAHRQIEEAHRQMEELKAEIDELRAIVERGSGDDLRFRFDPRSSGEQNRTREGVERESDDVRKRVRVVREDVERRRDHEGNDGDQRHDDDNDREIHERRVVVIGEPGQGEAEFHFDFDFDGDLGGIPSQIAERVGGILRARIEKEMHDGGSDSHPHIEEIHIEHRTDAAGRGGHDEDGEGEHQVMVIAEVGPGENEVHFQIEGDFNKIPDGIRGRLIEMIGEVDGRGDRVGGMHILRVICGEDGEFHHDDDDDDQHDLRGRDDRGGRGGKKMNRPGNRGGNSRQMRRGGDGGNRRQMGHGDHGGNRRQMGRGDDRPDRGQMRRGGDGGNRRQMGRGGDGGNRRQMGRGDDRPDRGQMRRGGDGGNSRQMRRGRVREPSSNQRGGRSRGDNRGMPVGIPRGERFGGGEEGPRLEIFRNLRRRGVVPGEVEIEVIIDGDRQEKQVRSRRIEVREIDGDGDEPRRRRASGRGGDDREPRNRTRSRGDGRERDRSERERGPGPRVTSERIYL